MSEIQEGKKTSIPRAWKIANYVSFVVIIGLVVLNVMGGDKQLRPGEIQDLLILPFENYTVDDTSASEITSELNVDAIIESNVLSLGDSICIQVRVISAFPEKETLWIADYKEEKSQILNLYNRLTKQIANDLRIQLSADEDIEQLKKMNLPLPEE